MAYISERPWHRPLARLTVLPKPTSPAPRYDQLACAFNPTHAFKVQRGAEHDRFCRPACMSAASRQAMFRQRREGSQP